MGIPSILKTFLFLQKDRCPCLFPISTFLAPFGKKKKIIVNPFWKHFLGSIADTTGICITKAMTRPLATLWRRPPGLGQSIPQLQQLECQGQVHKGGVGGLSFPIPELITDQFCTVVFELKQVSKSTVKDSFAKTLFFCKNYHFEPFGAGEIRGNS